MVGGLCALVGVFILTLPIPIVVNSFAAYYKNRLWRNEVAHKRAERMKRQTTSNVSAAANDEVHIKSTMYPVAASHGTKSSPRKGQPQEEEEDTMISPNGLDEGSLSVMKLREIRNENTNVLSQSDIRKCANSQI